MWSGIGLKTWSDRQTLSAVPDWLANHMIEQSHGPSAEANLCPLLELASNHSATAVYCDCHID